MHPLVLATHIDRKRFDFGVCVIEDARSAFRETIERAGYPIYDLHLSRRLYNPLNVFKIVLGFYRLFIKLQPHIVQTQALHSNLLGRLAAKLAGVPIVISTENSRPDIEKRLIHRLLNMPLHFFSNLLDRVTDAIVVVSQDIRMLKDRYGKSGKIELIYPPMNPVVLSAANPGQRTHRPLSAPQAPVLGIAGRLSPEKGHRYLLAALAEILTFAPEARLLIVGSGPLEAALKSHVQALHLTERVEFRGYQRDVFAEFARMDVLCAPSLSEGSPIVILEAMLAGLPVIASQVGGIPEVVVDGRTGILVPPYDASALTQALKYLLSHPNEGLAMSERGREHILNNYHPQKFISAHEQLYERLATACTMP